MSTTSNNSSDADCIAKFNIEDIAKGSYFESKLTGLHVLVSEIDGPKIDAFICLGTRVNSNNGVAHTLEHLVFTGSKNYSSRGILDRLANRCFAQGTNAWTSIDQTVYVISTASQDGLLNILPVYLDHIMNPIIVDDTFNSEVYSIKHDGTESGVVFSEMQAKETSEFSITYFAMMRQLFKPETGYCFNSGGELDSIRKLTIKEIIEFHEKYYRPDNMLIIVVGAVETKKIIEGIITIEEKILSKFISEERIQRPWCDVDVGTPIYGSIEVKFPSDNLSAGTLLIAIQGPLKENVIECLALNTLASYLSYFDESPLKSQCIIQKSLCSEIIYTILKFRTIYLQFKYFNMLVQNMDPVITIFKEFIEKVKKEGLDLAFLKKVINFEYYYFVNEFEVNPHDYISSKSIEFFLYGNRSIDLLNSMGERNQYSNLISKDITYWNNLFLKYFDVDKLVIVKGIGEKINSTQVSHFNENLQKITDKGNIKEHHEKPHVPLSLELMEEFPIPSVDDICYHKITTLCNFGAFDFENLSLHGFEAFDVPLAIQLDDIKSNILQVTLCVCLGKINPELLPLLSIVSKIPFEAPIQRKGVVLPSEDVKKQLDLIFFNRISNISWNCGFYELGIMSYYYFISLKTDIYHYEDTISWIKDLLFNNVLDTETLKKVILKCYQKCTNAINDPNGAVVGLSSLITFRKNTVNHCLSLFYQVQYLHNLLKTLQVNENEVKGSMNKLVECLKSDSNIQAHLMCDFKKLNSLSPSPHSQWQLNFSKYAKYSSHTPRTASNFNQDFIETNNFYQKILGNTSSDSSHLIQTIPSIRSYRDPDYPALTVLLEFLSGLEGPLWKRIRGKGLAYTSLVFCEPSDGLIYVKILKATNIVEAYRELRNILAWFSCEENDGFTQESIESAISGVVFEVINSESTICDAGLQNMLAQLKGLDFEFHKYFIKKVTEVNAGDLQRVAKKYLPKILDGNHSHIAISTSKAKLQDIVMGYKSMDINLTIYEPPVLTN